MKYLTNNYGHLINKKQHPYFYPEAKMNYFGPFNVVFIHSRRPKLIWTSNQVSKISLPTPHVSFSPL
jgi:hypothetical protein